MLWLGLDAAALAESLAHLLYTDKRNPFMIWVPMHGIQELKQEQQQMLLDVSCSFMTTSNSRKRDDDGVLPCLAPPTPAHTLSSPSIPEVLSPSIFSCTRHFIIHDAPLQVLSFFPVIAMPLPLSCSVPPPPTPQRAPEIPTPTCLLTELSV